MTSHHLPLRFPCPSGAILSALLALALTACEREDKQLSLLRAAAAAKPNVIGWQIAQAVATPDEKWILARLHGNVGDPEGPTTSTLVRAAVDGSIPPVALDGGGVLDDDPQIGDSRFLLWGDTLQLWDLAVPRMVWSSDVDGGTVARESGTLSIETGKERVILDPASGAILSRTPHPRKLPSRAPHPYPGVEVQLVQDYRGCTIQVDSATTKTLDEPNDPSTCVESPSGNWIARNFIRPRSNESGAQLYQVTPAGRVELRRTLHQVHGGVFVGGEYFACLDPPNQQLEVLNLQTGRLSKIKTSGPPEQLVPLRTTHRVVVIDERGILETIKLDEAESTTTEAPPKKP